MPQYEPTKLTETFIRDLPLEGIAYAVRDTKVTGLFVAVNKTASRTRSSATSGAAAAASGS